MKKIHKGTKNNKGKYIGKTIAVSGGFDPLHVGHLKMFESAKKLVGVTGKLIVFINTDVFLLLKKNKAFMKLQDRMRLVKALRMVDMVCAVVDKDISVCKTLKKYKPDVFANGGDRTKNNIPEIAVCQQLGITMLFNVGGKKARSSSELLKEYGEKGKQKSV